MSRPVLLSGSVTLAVLAWCAFVGLSPIQAALPRQQLPTAARAFASSLFLVAGVLRLVRWRLADDLVAGREAVALLVLAAAVRVHQLVGEPLAVRPDPAVHTLALAAVFALLLPAVGRPDPLRRIAYRCAGALGAVAVVCCVVLIVRASYPSLVPTVWVAVDCAGALGWLMVASRSWRVFTPGSRGKGRPMIAAMVLMSAGEWTAAGSLAGSRTLAGIAPGLQLAAASLATVAALSELRQTLSDDDTQNADATQVLADLQRRLAGAEQAQRERLHDARSAVAGVLAASALLARGADTGALDHDRLGQLMTAELQRLQGLLDADAVEPITEFDLFDALQPVVLIHQLDARVIRTELRSLPVIGRPRATATVLDSLLRNARLHAPASRIEVTADHCGGIATIVVEDDGPGLPPDEYERVLASGVRGSSATAPGSGLGLSNALTMMRAQGGSLEFGGRVGGGTRVTLTLPAVVATTGDHALAS